jgi:CheY-like chemotaxis protein
VTDDTEPPSSGQQRTEARTPPHGKTLKQLTEDLASRPGPSDPTLAHVLERVERILAVITAPNGRLASLDDRMATLLCGLRSVASAVMAIEELQSTMPPTSSVLEGLTILIVDDELLIQNCLRRVLANARGTTILAGNADRAMDILRTERVDVALVDLRLAPGPTGIYLCRHIRTSYPGVAIVIMTGSLSEEDATVADELSIAVVEKPASNLEVIAAIREAHGARPAATAGP